MDVFARQELDDRSQRRHSLQRVKGPSVRREERRVAVTSPTEVGREAGTRIREGLFQSHRCHRPHTNMRNKSDTCTQAPESTKLNAACRTDVSVISTVRTSKTLYGDDGPATPKAIAPIIAETAIAAWMAMPHGDRAFSALWLSVANSADRGADGVRVVMRERSRTLPSATRCCSMFV